MPEERYQVLTAPALPGVSIENVTAELAAEYPAYEVEVHEHNNEFVAKLTRKQAAPPKGKVPPFLDEEDDAPKGDAPDPDADAPEVPDAEEPEDEDAPPKKDKADKPDKDDEGEGGGSDLSKALKAVETLKSVLPKLETQLKELNGGELPEGLDALGEGAPHGLGPDGVPPGGPGGPGGPSQAMLDAVGPTPGKPTPGNAAPRIPGLGMGGPKVPRPNVGVPTFSHVKQNRFVYRPALNEDGSRISMAEATEEITRHPRYASYDVHEIKLDETGDQYVAHLKLRSE